MVTDSEFLASDFDYIQSEDIKHIYFQPILEHMFSFVMRLLATRCTFLILYLFILFSHLADAFIQNDFCDFWILREFVVIGTTLKSGSVWSSVE